MKTQSSFTKLSEIGKDILNITLFLLAVLGYANTIIKLSKCDFDSKTSYKAEIVHTIGLVACTGIITGYLNLGK